MTSGATATWTPDGRKSLSDSTTLTLAQNRTALGRTGDLFRAAAVTALWAVYMVAAWGFRSESWQESLPPLHLYLVVSWMIVFAVRRDDRLARRSVWLVPLLDMPMLFWIESIHAPMARMPAEIVGYTAAGFVILVMWTALALDARFTMFSAALGGALQATLSHLNGGNALAIMISMTLMLVAGAMTVVTTTLLVNGLRDVVEARIKKQEALRISEEKDHFISTVTHDFRTPLSVLLAALQSLQADPNLSLELRTDILSRAVRQCRRLMLMTEDLFNLAQLGARPPTLSLVDLGDLARETVRTLSSEATQRGKALVGPPPDRDLHARVDSSLLERALSNLVDNALRYGGPKVEVRLLDEGEMVHLIVVDDGPGIAETDVDKIFDPFYRGSGGGKGTGLGLAIVREVAHVHGGRARVRSRVGEGTTFELILPRAESAVRVKEMH